MPSSHAINPVDRSRSLRKRIVRSQRSANVGRVMVLAGVLFVAYRLPATGRFMAVLLPGSSASQNSVAAASIELVAWVLLLLSIGLCVLAPLLESFGSRSALKQVRLSGAWERLIKILRFGRVIKTIEADGKTVGVVRKAIPDTVFEFFSVIRKLIGYIVLTTAFALGLLLYRGTPSLTSRTLTVVLSAVVGIQSAVILLRIWTEMAGNKAKSRDVGKNQPLDSDESNDPPAG